MPTSGDRVRGHRGMYMKCISMRQEWRMSVQHCKKSQRDRMGPLGEPDYRAPGRGRWSFSTWPGGNRRPRGSLKAIHLYDKIPTLCVLSIDQMATLIDDGGDESPDDTFILFTLSASAEENSPGQVDFFLQARPKILTAAHYMKAWGCTNDTFSTTVTVPHSTLAHRCHPTKVGTQYASSPVPLPQTLSPSPGSPRVVNNLGVNAMGPLLEIHWQRGILNTSKLSVLRAYTGNVSKSQ